MNLQLWKNSYARLNRKFVAKFLYFLNIWLYLMPYFYDWICCIRILDVMMATDK